MSVDRDHPQLKALIQEQLRDLGFPTVGGCDTRPVFDGRSIYTGDNTGVTYIAGHLRTQFGAPGTAVPPRTFLVLAPRPQTAAERETRLRTGWTLVPVGPREVIRYQCVIVDTATSRDAGFCPDGIFYEAEAARLLPWDGVPLIPSAKLAH